jgi:hypothetical protein
MHQKKQEVLTSSRDPLIAIPNHSEPDAKKSDAKETKEAPANNKE